jgi:hypothetical protein
MKLSILKILSVAISVISITSGLADAKPPKSIPILSGSYWNKPTGVSLIVSGNKFRYIYDDGDPSQWKPIDRLQSIRKGVVIDPTVKDSQNKIRYWCSTTIEPKSKGNGFLICSRNGFRPF